MKLRTYLFSTCRPVLYATLLMVLFTACNSGGSTNDEGANDTAQEAIETNEKDFYKRFSGTIAGQPVVMSFHKYGSNVSATYYYEKQGRLIHLYAWDDTVKDDNKWRFSEASATGQDDYDKSDYWMVTLSGSKLSGTWHSGDNTQQHPIELKEDYPKGSYRLAILNIEDSAAAIANKLQPMASSMYQSVIPGAKMDKADADFLNGIISKSLSCTATDLKACIATQNQKYFDGYRKEMSELDSADLAAPMNNYSEGSNNWVIYNDRGWIIIQNMQSSYTGGAHGMYASAYFNLDMQNRKEWVMKDVVTADSMQLTPLLNEAARNYFRLKSNTPLNEALFENYVSLTDNFYITPTGLVFAYTPYEIAAYAVGEVNLFIPYTKLNSYLTPAFKQRMGLE